MIWPTDRRSNPAGSRIFAKPVAKCRSRCGENGPRAAAAGDGSPEGRRALCSNGLAAPAEHVDHDHKTGAVRGAMCFGRHAAPGQFKDRPDAARRAAEYVEGNVWKPTLVALGVYQLPS
ncbi:endonuclease domain-containing protein [Streptomyces mobaraensis]|uniref:Uncharacterized protein n=1 Tax=Streptomyces mobaraensis TaxID=35621 RepID=A0A5N5W1D7_STRMB|nr:endonuclease domain-containing protein [Streptomyces mobaraensis]KAB7834471.1 hypothetical protein FRZ00_29435 [Streptomyces mobaraensis]